MPDPPPAAGDPTTARPSAELEIERLRQLLGVADAVGVEEILRRLDDPEVRARDLSGVLPDAVRLSARSDTRLGDALEPSVQRAVHNAIHRDPKPFARALYPALAPAIRRAISETLRSMVQSLNEILTNTLSVRALKWRWQAYRTKRPFAEVVLSNSLVFKTQQVFLIHRETGLLLQHVVDPQVETQDPDLVSSMLTAIQDFVRDSFGVGDDEGLEDFRVGDLTIWIERGRDAVLAVAIRGNAPESLREQLRESLHIVQLSWHEQLANFSGDAGVFEETQDALRECLISSYHPPSSRPSPLLWIVLLALLLALGWWIVSMFREHQRWVTLRDHLEAAPGIAITSSTERHGIRTIRGLRDPLSPDPADIALRCGFADGRVRFVWESFTSLEKDLVLRRATNILEPPPEVVLTLEDGTLQAVGPAPARWIQDAKELAPGVPGVHEFIHLGELAEPSENLVAIADRAQRRLVRFPVLSAEILAGDLPTVENLASDLGELIRRSDAERWRPVVTLIGHADSSGAEALNLELSRRRAIAVRAALEERGIPADALGVTGVGSSQPLSTDDSSGPTDSDRRVSVKIDFVAVGGGGG
jgi:OOP family OmpA-OmpF porin